MDEFIVVLGSNAKAWAVVVQWLSICFVDKFSLSRQGERLLRKTLKGEGADVVEALIEQLAVTMGAVKGEVGGFCKCRNINNESRIYVNKFTR